MICNYKSDQCQAADGLIEMKTGVTIGFDNTAVICDLIRLVRGKFWKKPGLERMGVEKIQTVWRDKYLDTFYKKREVVVSRETWEKSF